MDNLEIRHLRNGMQVFIRPVRPSDKVCLERGFTQLSEASKYYRFFTHLPRLTEDMLKQFTEVDHKDQVALCAGVIQEHGWNEAGIIRYMRIPHQPHIAELALIVVDAYQNLGLGSMLFEMIRKIALRNGIHTLRGDVLPENHAMIHLLQKWNAQGNWEPGSYFRYDIHLKEAAADVAAVFV